MGNILGRSLVLLGTFSLCSSFLWLLLHLLDNSLLYTPFRSTDLLTQFLAYLSVWLSFSINLGCSSRDLAFHFNPRFNESVIVCNSKRCDSWQTEHRDRHLPFFRGCTVKFFIEMLSDKFRVKLPDGHEVCFPNRHGYSNINYMSIVGGLKIISFKMT